MKKWNFLLNGMILSLVPSTIQIYAQGNQYQPTDTGSSGSKDSRPNILLLVGETHSPILGCYGAPVKTPNLDKLASEGTRFQYAYVCQSGSSPSRASVFTGLYPHQHGQVGLATWNYSMYQENTPNFVNDLKKSGYMTGIIGKIHVNPESAFDFDMWEIHGGNRARNELESYTKYAEQFIKASEKPFFLQISYADAHVPFLRQVDGRPANPLNGKDVDVLPYIGISSDSLKQNTADYYNCIMRLDEYIGDLIVKLKESGKYENTIIVYIGDHGEDIIRGKRTCYEGGLRIPFIISWPGIGKSSVVYNGLVSTIDLYPTFMEASGNPIPEYLPGKSLIPAIKGDKKPVREYLFAEFNVHSNYDPYPQRTVRDSKYKLIYNLCPEYTNPGYDYTIGHLVDRPDFEAALKFAPKNIIEAYTTMKDPPEFELYDLTKDPYEWDNLAYEPEFAAILEKYKKVIVDWQKETNDPFIDKKVAERFFLEVMSAKGKKIEIKYHDYMDPKMVFKQFEKTVMK